MSSVAKLLQWAASSWTHVTQRNGMCHYVIDLTENAQAIRKMTGHTDCTCLAEDEVYCCAYDPRPTTSKHFTEQEFSGVAPELQPKVCRKIWDTTEQERNQLTRDLKRSQRVNRHRNKSWFAFDKQMSFTPAGNHGVDASQYRDMRGR